MDAGYVTKVLQELVQINSVNPMLVPGAPGEQAIAVYLAEQLSRLGLHPEVEELAPGRFNVTAVIAGQGGRSLLFNAHTDTVGVAGMTDPFSGQLIDGRICGRGAQDMKGSIAAILGMAKVLAGRSAPPKGDVILTFVADEEYASIGTERVVEQFRADAAIVAEPTDLSICTAHKGFGVFAFTTQGRAAHGGRPQDGIDANAHMARLLTALQDDWHAVRPAAHPLLGEPSWHIPLIRGGSELFMYAAECSMQLERRILPGEAQSSILAEYGALLDRLAAANPAFRAAIHPVMWRDPYEIDPGRPIVQSLHAASSQVLGRSPGYIGHSWWEDSAILGQAGIETVIMGPVGAGIHTTEEWVDVQSVIDLAEIFVQTLEHFQEHV